MEQVQSIQQSAVIGQGGVAPYPSGKEMLAGAQNSRIQSQQQWHDDRKAKRDFYRQQASVPGSTSVLPTAAIVRSRIQCETCGRYIEAEVRGSRYYPKSIYFYPVRGQRVKLATQTSFINQQILQICGECAARKQTPAALLKKGEKPKGLPAEYAVVKHGDWAKFATHTDLKRWLWWRRTLCENILFRGSFFLAFLQWLCTRKSLEEEKPSEQPSMLYAFAILHTPTMTAAGVPVGEETMVPSSPNARQLLLFEQQRLFTKRSVAPEGERDSR